MGKRFLERGSHAINSAMERFFGSLGYWVSGRPRVVVIVCLLFTFLFMIGFKDFVMLSDPEDLFTPSEATVLDDDNWHKWFEELPLGVPEEGNGRVLEELDPTIASERVITGDGGGIWNEGANRMAKQLQMYGFDPANLSEDFDDEDHPYAKAIENYGRPSMQQRTLRMLLDYGEQAWVDRSLCHMDNVIVYRPPETASSVDFLENNAEHVRAAIEIQLNVIDHFGLEKVCWAYHSQPRIKGIGECWDWNLATFDADSDRIGTLSECIKHNRILESTFMSGVEKNVNTGRLTQVTGLYTSFRMKISQPEILEVDQYITSQETDDVHMAPIGWAGINNSIYAALIHDMPYTLGPILILLIYVSHIFYRNNSDSHMTLAYAGIANVFMAVLSGIGLTLAWGTGFTALHICAVYITLGIGIDDAFIITAAVYDTQKQLGKFGNEEIRRRVREGMSRCGPSILLTSLTDFFAFVSNSSSNVFAIRNFSIVAGIMVLIDFIFQVTFFISTLVIDMQRQEDNRCDVLCCFNRGRHKALRNTANEDGGFNNPQNRKLSDYDYPSEFERSKSTESEVSALSHSPVGENGSFFPDRRSDGSAGAGGVHPVNTHTSSSSASSSVPLKKKKYSKRIMDAVLYPVILNQWGKITVLVVTAVAIMIGFAGSSKLSIKYTPFILVPEGSYIHTNREIMHEYFPWIMEENWTCVQTKKADYSLYQQELLDLEKFACGEASRDQCFAWYSLLRLYVSTKYINDQDKFNSLFDSEGMLHRDDFYRELKEFSRDETIGGRSTTDQFVSWESEEQLVGSQMCFLWKREYNIPQEIDWMVRKRKEVKEIAPGLNPSLFTKYFYSIEALSTIVPDTLRNFSIISGVVLLVCLIVLANIKATFLVLGSVMTIELIVLGSLHFFEMHFNMMTSIMLIVGVGLCVDFSAHSAHAFLHSKKHGAHDKVRDALDTVGVSIWNGAFSSILAMLPMYVCKSYFVQTWWRVISLVITLGIYYGLCVIPVMLTLFDDDDVDDFSDWTIVSPEGKKNGSSFADFAKNEGRLEGGDEGESVELSLVERSKGKRGAPTLLGGDVVEDDGDEDDNDI